MGFSDLCGGGVMDAKDAVLISHPIYPLFDALCIARNFNPTKILKRDCMFELPISV